ncbi:MAG: FAD-dependent oxidoreductase [Candidatus Binatia bacterium]
MAVTPPGLRWHEEVDVGIVGAGGCGLAAAHAAADATLKVVIWEKGDAAGGNTALSCGRLAAAGTRQQRQAGIFEVGEDFARDVLARNGGRSDPALVRRLCESSADLVDWLSDKFHIELELVRQVADPGHSRLRLHAPASCNGQPIVKGLLRSLDRQGIRLHLLTPVLQLWTDANGAVLGVQVKRPRKTPANIRCQKLILATDGFGANAELLARHCPRVAGLKHAGHSGSSGDAMRWASELGAATQDLDAYEAYASVAVGSNLLVPWLLISEGGLLVNQRGERFADETGGPAALVTPVLSQPGRVAYELFDARIFRMTMAADAYFATDVVPRAVRRADEVESLAKQFQIDPQALARAVESYNVAVCAGSDGFGRTTFGEPLAAPFYGIRVAPALLQTLGGLAIDSSARVLRIDRSIVPNLYAGGGAAVSISGLGEERYLPGTGLLCALGWGKIAGEQAAHEILAARAGSTHQGTTPSSEGETP